MIRWISCILLLIPIACNRSSNTAEISKPMLDFSTPDNAIKSAWRLAIWADTSRVDTTNYQLFTKARIEKQRLHGIQRLEKARRKHPFARNTITDVQVKSELYAIVEAKEFFEYSDKSVDTKCILSKEQGQWKIDEYFHKCSVCDGTGKQTDYDQKLKDMDRGLYHTEPKKECTLCKGSGWLSSLPEPE